MFTLKGINTWLDVPISPPKASLKITIAMYTVNQLQKQPQVPITITTQKLRNLYSIYLHGVNEINSIGPSPNYWEHLSF